MLKIFRHCKYYVTFYCVSKCLLYGCGRKEVLSRCGLSKLFHGLPNIIMSDSFNCHTVVTEMHMVLSLNKLHGCTVH